jgi:hypothetical protein
MLEIIFFTVSLKERFLQFLFRHLHKAAKFLKKKLIVMDEERSCRQHAQNYSAKTSKRNNYFICG